MPGAQTRYRALVRRLLEGTQFIGAHTGAVIAFRGAFVLHYFHQRLVARASAGIVLVHGATAIRFGAKHKTCTQIGVMRNYQRVAAVVCVKALRIELAPQQLRGGAIDVAWRQLWNPAVAEHDIAMQVAAGIGAHTGPLVADERGELTGRAAIVVRLRSLLHFAPGNQRGAAAQFTVVATQSHVGLAYRGHVVEQVVGAPGPVAIKNTLPGTVSLHLRRVTHVDLANQFSVVGDHGKIQRPSQLQ